MAEFREVRQVDLTQLIITNGQARRRNVRANLDELVDNLRVHGQLEPIVIAPTDNPAEEKYEVIAGQRRYLAAKQLGWPTILAAIYESSIDHTTARALPSVRSLRK